MHVLYQSAYDIWTACFHRLQTYDWRKLNKMSTRLWPCPSGGLCHCEKLVWIGEVVSIIVIPKLTLDIFYLCTNFGDSRFSRSGDMIAGVETANHVTMTMPLLGVLCHPKAGTWNILLVPNLTIDSSFSRSRNITGGRKI